MLSIQETAKKIRPFAVSDSDGTLEYVDFYKGSIPDRKPCWRRQGSVPEICIGDTYAVTYTYNDYEFRIYQKNNRSTPKPLP